MAICRNCGNLGNIDSKFCPNCGEPLAGHKSSATTEKKPDTTYGNFNPNFNQTGSSQSYKSGDDQATLFCVIGFCVPIAGLILYLVLMNDKPASAKGAGLGALIGFIVSLLGALISFGLQAWFI